MGAFLGSALLLASQQGSALKGVTLLLAYSLGLGVPFLLSALLLDQLKSAFDWIKRHYRPIELISGRTADRSGHRHDDGTSGPVAVGPGHLKEERHECQEKIPASAPGPGGDPGRRGHCLPDAGHWERRSRSLRKPAVRRVPPPWPPPDFTVYDAEGNAVTLSSLLGKPAVLNFWASTCPPAGRRCPTSRQPMRSWERTSPLS